MKVYKTYKSGKRKNKCGQGYHIKKNHSAFSPKRPFIQTVAQPYEVSLVESPTSKDREIKPAFHIRSGVDIEEWKEQTGSPDDFGDENRFIRVHGVETPKLTIMAKTPNEAKKKYLEEVEGEEKLKKIPMDSRGIKF